MIEPDETEWASRFVFVHKTSVTLHFCVHYWKLNFITVRYSYLMPRMDKRVDSLGSAQVCLTRDNNSGYWQITAEREDREKTSFTSRHGLYQLMGMPFGLKNALDMSQRLINVILSTVKCK